MVPRMLLIIIIIHSADNSPIRTKRSPRDIGNSAQPSILISTLQNTGTRLVPVFSQNGGSHSISVTQHLVLKNDAHLIAPIPLSQFYLHKLQVIPRPNVIHTSDVKIPVISHHSVTHSSPNANTTQSHSVIPVFIHGILPGNHQHDLSVIPVNHQHDLSVIPLRPHKEKGHYRMEKHHDDEEMNSFRNFYGGHGTGLLFGGHGHGHGFYAYGK